MPARRLSREPGDDLSPRRVPMISSKHFAFFADNDGCILSLPQSAGYQLLRMPPAAYFAFIFALGFEARDY